MDKETMFNVDFHLPDIAPDALERGKGIKWYNIYGGEPHIE